MNLIEHQRTCWLKQLADMPPAPKLPSDKQRPPVSSFLRETVSRSIEARVWAGVKALAEETGASPQAVLLSAAFALLSRYTGQTDLVVGTILAKSCTPMQAELIPLRVAFDIKVTIEDLVRQVAATMGAASENLQVPADFFAELRKRREADSSQPVPFNTILTFTEKEKENGQPTSVKSVESRRAEFFTLCPLVFRVVQTDGDSTLTCEFDAELFEAATAARVLGHFSHLLCGMLRNAKLPVDCVDMLDGAEKRQLLEDWNNTSVDFPRGACVHQLFEAQVEQTPDAVAVICQGEQLTYRELNARANQLAAYLTKLNVQPDMLVGICLERSLDMFVGLLGILKAGCAYLPLDPTYPAERIGFMIEDARVTVLVTQERLANSLPSGEARIVQLDADWPAIAVEDEGNVRRQVGSERLAYVIYTSGSTGKPKGVMVEHRNVVNFFAGMDERVSHEPGSTWLAVTSLSFDISVLEVFWTLCRGFKVVLFPGEQGIPPRDRGQTAERSVEFSLFYFSSDQSGGPGGPYRLLIEGAKYADEHGFSAVWTPERHFHEFGGLYPNPSVTSAAVAMVTKRVQIRSGSVVAPLHSPIRIAEEWSVVDNLSNGRAAISFASGWMPEDFTIQPANYADRKAIMFRDIDIVCRLWRGESVQMPGPLGKDVSVRTLPRPIQRELPVWVTAAGNPETFEMAGKLGANVLTHLLGQSIKEVAEKVAVYRKAWREAGHSGSGRVALMLHTFVGESVQEVKATVRQPLIEYLRKSTDLIKGYAWAFTAFKRQPKSAADIDFSTLPKEQMDALLAHSFERYFETSGLFGTPESCLARIEELKAKDIDEVACLVDFGINPDLVLENLKYLDLLRKAVSGRSQKEKARDSIPELIERHAVTHLQCTPSMAGMLLMDDRSKAAFGRLRCLLIGGEAFPSALAAQLKNIIPGDLINMYGPTETTVWSSSYSIPNGVDRVAVGRPIANTLIYILDRNLKLVPVGTEGELMIGGAGVARGYLNRLELTAERFISNPFNSNCNNRLYRTGDLARYLPDGNIELLGRIDQQVKIRGHRIELGEIEATLNLHPMVREAVVVAKPGSSGDKKLVAYVIPREGQKPGASQLRGYTKEKLPDYMVPAHVVFLTAFPQTPNKKIDRNALPAPEDSAVSTEAKIEAPTSEVEEALCDVYGEVLQVGAVGRNDDFFELGGDSLSAVQLLSRIRQTCDVELPLESLFDSPTVAGLAKRLEGLFLAKAGASDRVSDPHSGTLDAKGNGSQGSEQIAATLARISDPPRTGTEERLAKVWAEVLGLERVGRDDNFFALGGNSLAAIQLTTRLASVFRIQLPLETLFNAPTVHQLAAFLETDAPLQAVVEKEVCPLAKAGPPATPEAASSILCRKNLNEYPLSSGQQRLWFLQHLEGGCHYNDHFNLRLTGGINVPVLERSIQEILTRHEAMRTTFSELDGRPVQRVDSFPKLTLPVVELRGLQTESRLNEAIRLAVEEASKPFDLATGPLWRFHLVKIDDEDHLLLITAHHIAIDGWSRSVFLNEFCALYKAFLLGEPSPLSELRIQYADYAAWQSEWLKSDELTRQLDYWKQRMSGSPALLELPSDRPRPPIQSFRGARHYFTLPKSLTADLKNLSRHERVTLFMSLLAGFQCLLQRYTGQEDVLVGTPVANRPRTEIQGLIGYFLNTVVLRGDCSGNPTFRQLLKRVRATSLEAFGNQDLPVEKVIDALQLERNQSYSPLFQVFFVFQNAPASEADIPGLSVRPFDIDNGTAKFDLTVNLFENDDGLAGWLEYATDLFDAATMERMLGHYSTLLEAAVANPDLPLARLALLTAGERSLILGEWNQTNVEYLSSRCVHEIVEEQAALFPDRIALEFAGRQMTYAELDQRTTLLATHLQSLGVGPDSLVCLCLDRSLDMVVGLLGVLKAGGAYVPLDPGYPAERLAFILADARAKVLLTETRLLPTLSSLEFTGKDVEAPAIVCLDELLMTRATALSVRPIERTVRPENLAYVIYTSGSTGKPKGVQVQHRSVFNFLNSMRRTPGLTAEDVLLAVTTLSFDIAGLEVFLPLTTGARVIIASREATVDGVQLSRLIDESGVTMMQATPATWRLLIEAGWKGNPKLKILCGGEPWTKELAEALLSRCGSLWNMYGPTETTIWSSVCEVTRGQPVLIGRPIANTQFYVLDQALQPVPVGVPGELHIGGHGVARGYANRQSLTDEKFVSDPFAGQPAARMYKTGDLVKYRPDGNIEYLGRIDHQVKIRGFRIELGEIESVLAAHPGLRENVVVVRQDRPDEKQLVAYCVAAASPAPIASELRQHLLRKLPDYMVPSVFVLLPALPRLPNGKIDRKALPVPDIQGEGKSFTAPVSAVQRALAETWKGLLRVSQVGLYDNFFELGGHSLLAMQLIARVRNALKVEVNLQQFFAAPTLIEMSQAVESAQGRGRNASSAVPALHESASARKKDLLPQAASPFLASALTGVEIDRALISRVFPVSFAQQRLWFLEQLEPNTAVYNLAYAFRLRGSINLQAVRLSLQSILDRHEPLRSILGIVGADPVQVILGSCPLDVPLVDLSGLPPIDRKAETQKLAEAEARRPFNLARDLMLRAKVLRLDDEEHLLLITMHHIVSDFWSVGVLFREFATAYEKYLKGMDGSLPVPAVQYADFAVWQRDYLQGEILENQLIYWKRQLAGAPPLLSLPIDHHRPQQQTYAGAVASLHLSKDLRDSLQELSRREGVTLFMTMLAAFKVLLYRYSEQDDIVVGSPIAGRNEPETEDLIGFFVNTVVLRTDLSGYPAFKDLLARVRDTALGAYAYQDLPFEKLVDELQPERNLSYNPLCQVLFSFQNPAVPPLESAGITLTLESVSTGTAKFDLALFITEQSDGIVIWTEYNTDLFEKRTINQLLEGYQSLLEGVVADSSQKISELPLLTSGERRQLLIEWNDTQASYAKDLQLHQLFEAQVERTPEAVAAVFGEQRLTYKELNRRANQLAHHLRSCGVGPDVLVALGIERSLEMVVGLLGILKSGGAYVPIDLAYPPDRIAFMLEDAKSPVVVTQRSSVGRLPKHLAVTVCLDELSATLPDSNPISSGGAGSSKNLCYVIYTSGSTGRPKGVEIPHQAVVNFLASMQREPGLSREDTFLALTTLSFDIAGLEIFLPLITGARVVVASHEAARDPRQISELLIRNEVTVAQATPATWRMLLETDWMGTPNLKVLCGGEAMARDLAEKLLEHCSQVWNMYGPTETTIWSTIRRLIPGQSITIGRPIANTRAYVVDGQLQLLPVGAIGELLIGGAGVARGYRNRPELTAEKFITDHFAPGEWPRLYRTGDLARYLPNGEIECLGRKDSQVKVNGFRIELGEIESVLAGHASIRQCAVVMREDVPGDRRLAAYVVLATGQTSTVGELRDWLRDRLPDYMVPSALLLVDHLPMTPNGKVDRKALPRVDEMPAISQIELAAPEDGLEQKIAGIWQEVLGITQVGRDSNFFDVGENSLSIIRVRTRLESLLGRQIAVINLFKHTTVKALAEYLKGGGDQAMGIDQEQESLQTRREAAKGGVRLRQRVRV